MNTSPEQRTRFGQDASRRREAEILRSHGSDRPSICQVCDAPFAPNDPNCPRCDSPRQGREQKGATAPQKTSREMQKSLRPTSEAQLQERRRRAKRVVSRLVDLPVL